jgi:hypothetical protein
MKLHITLSWNFGIFLFKTQRPQKILELDPKQVILHLKTHIDWYMFVFWLVTIDGHNKTFSGLLLLFI